jgi:predicted flap endonuclease-1-like 5' DNA nuclease
MTQLPYISAPASRGLAEAGVSSLEDVAKMTEKELASIHAMGPKGIRILKEALKQSGLSLKKG